MKKDRKLSALAISYEFVIESTDAYMWFALPGALLTGRPINPEEYIELLMRQKAQSPSEEDQEKQRRFFHLKDAELIQGNNHNIIGIALFDGLEVGAWGFYDKATSGLSQPNDAE